MRSRVLSILMWKHMVVRIRRFIHTTVDFLSPLIFFILLFIFKDDIQPDGDTFPESKNPVAYTDIIPLAEVSQAPNRIVYYPESPLTESLMDEVGSKLNLKRLSSYPDISTSGYYPLANESQMGEFSSRIQKLDAIVIFHKMLGESWPERLNYTIRMKDVFQTESYVSLDDTPGPHRMFGINYGTFMRLQWAIDTSYIKLLTGSEVPQMVSLQEFPYYHTRRNANTYVICHLLMVVCWLSLMLPYVFLMCRLLQERTSGIQELMKMVGVGNNMIGLSHFLNILPCGLIFSIGGTILLKITSNPLIPNSDGYLIFLILLLHYLTIIALAFVFSFFSKSTRYAATLSVVSYVCIWVPRRMVLQYSLPYPIHIASGMLPYSPMNWFWDEVAVLELYDRGLTFSNMMTQHENNSASAFMCIIYLMLQSTLFFAFAWYLSLVRPGRYGQALPWNFCFQAQYWSKNNVKPEEDSEEEGLTAHDPRYFEPPPTDAQPGIRVVNVSKVYPKHKALNNVNLDVYKGEITVLLGHNGAGKTTLMSIITGMTSATEGKVYVHGKDTVKQKSEVRQHLGLCPQHNLFFSDLTVKEHIMFFYLLKRGSYSEAREAAGNLATQLSLDAKLGALTRELSGGMKRRVQLACALAGGADVLVLDEPTSGLDVETRRELWDLLLSLRSERTVLLTTHFMEEADALGDRVAALHAGTLRCFATTMHLKKAVGTGYRLSFTTIGFPREQAISYVVMLHVPDASLKEQTINSISYSLPASRIGKFPRLFSALESKRSELGIDSIGVGVSTLEEVFLKLCSDVDTAVSEDEVDGVDELQETSKRLTGFALYLQQFRVLMMRQVKYIIHKKWIFLSLQVVLPVLMIMLMTSTTNNLPPSPPRALALALDVYADRERRVMLHLAARDLAPTPLMQAFPRVNFENVADVAEAVLRAGEKDILDYNKYLVGVELNETEAKILYTTTVRHAAPVALNLLSNLLATRYITWADGHTITTLNDPVEGDVRFRTATNLPKSVELVVMWGFTVTFLILATSINCVSLPSRERESGSRHIHLMCGCPAELHWGATLLFHALLCGAVLVLPTVLAARFLDDNNTINQPDLLVALTVILILGLLAFLSLMYLVSFYYGERTTSIILVVCIVVFGVVTPSMRTAQDIFQSPGGVLYSLLSVCLYVAAPHALVTAALRAANVARLNAWCRMLRSYCPSIFQTEKGMDVEKCCAGQNPRCYFCIDEFSPGEGMIILFVQFIVTMTMVILTQRGIFNGLLNKMCSLYRPAPFTEVDEMVRAEKTYVSKAITLPPKQIPDAMLVDDIHKNYVNLFGKNVNAVKGVSFSVKKGECFGLLGVNGAGKSTTFKMLTAAECATRGNIFGNGHHLRRGNSKYLQTLGYCPQFFGLDMFQTGEENLATVLSLRGYERHRVKQEAAAWLKIVGLEKYARRRVEAYSGGCVRRLGAATALCGGAQLALLDEPSAGVDVAARRRLWAALRAGLRHQRSVIITSHSMDEMEALCSRIAILVGGRVRALGTPAGLRAQHAAGHAVVFKVTYTQARDEVDGKNLTNQLKEKVNQKFNCTLKDEHKTMLHYHINETMRYSELFSALEDLKENFPTLIEDYSVTETTLEEVFLSFAKEQTQDVETA